MNRGPSDDWNRRITLRLATILPLPKGEGRGEGEQEPVIHNQRPFASVHGRNARISVLGNSLLGERAGLSRRSASVGGGEGGRWLFPQGLNFLMLFHVVSCCFRAFLTAHNCYFMLFRMFPVLFHVRPLPAAHPASPAPGSMLGFTLIHLNSPGLALDWLGLRRTHLCRRPKGGTGFPPVIQGLPMP
jgi:hypothetical protein